MHFVTDGEVFVVESGVATTGRLEDGEFRTISKEHFETIRRQDVPKPGDYRDSEESEPRMAGLVRFYCH